jgi:hypothetical protein
MPFTINSGRARTYTRAALWSAATAKVLSGVVWLIIGVAASPYLIRTFHLSPTLVHGATAVVFLLFLIAMATELYRISRLSSAIASSGLSLDVLGSAASGPMPANPTAILEFEKRMVDMARPFAWARTIGDVILGAICVALTVVALRHVGPLDRSTMVPYLFAAMFVLIIFGGVVSDIYRSWAVFSIPLDKKTNVVVKPVEQLLLVTWLAVIAAFAALFVASGSPQIIVTAVVIGLIVAALTIQNYRQTVSHTIVNPIDVAPITIDSSETIAIAIAGLTLAAGGLLQKVAFGRRPAQQSYRPQSGRVLNPWAQNALLVSETRLYFIFVPIGLGDQGPEGLSMMESLLGGKQIRVKLDEMLRTMTLKQIYESDPINFALDLSDVGRFDIVQRTDTRQVVAFVDRNGGKIRAFVDVSPELAEFEALMQRTGRSSVGA